MVLLPEVRVLKGSVAKVNCCVVIVGYYNRIKWHATSEGAKHSPSRALTYPLFPDDLRSWFWFWRLFLWFGGLFEFGVPDFFF